VASLAGHDGPTAFAIPGNHDWIDGLETFQRHILHKVVPMCGLISSGFLVHDGAAPTSS